MHAGHDRIASALVGCIARLLPADVRDDAAGDLIEQWAVERRSRLWIVTRGLQLAWGLRAGRAHYRPRTPRPSGGLMNGLWQDVRLAARLLITHRQFSAMALALLTLAVGVTTAIFSVVNAVLLRPLPYAEPDRLVAVASLYRGPNGERARPAVTLEDVAAWRPRARSFDAIGAFAYTQLPVQAGAASHSPVTALMDPQFLPALGVPLAMGSFFDTDPAAAPAAIVSHAFWRDALGADPAWIGRAISVDGEPFVVRGVLAPGFQFPRSDASYADKPVALMIPASTFPGFPATARQWLAIARLTEGVSIAAARAEMASIAEGLATRDAAGGYWTTRVMPLDEETTRRSREALVVSLGIAVVLFLVAATNLMNLFFSRAVGRMGEFSVRRALGCTTLRLVRQLLIEALMLALAGGAAGLLLASIAVNGLVALSPLHLPVSGTVGIDARVIAFTAAICVAAAVLASIFPALHASAGSRGAVRSGGLRTTHGGGVAQVQRALCIAQVGLGVALLACAGLLSRSLWQLQHVEPGYDPAGVVGFNISVPNSISLDARAEYYQRALDEVRATPGVEHAGLISFLPPETRAGVMMGLAIDGVPADPTAPRIVNTLITSPGYFETMRMGLVRGRSFSERDGKQSAPVVILNETAVKRFLGEGDPVGRRVGTGFDGMKPVREVIGVVRDARDRGAAAAPMPTVYIPFQQFALPYGAIAARTADTEAVMPMLRERLGRLNAAVPIFDFQTIEQRMSDSLREPRFYMAMAVICASLAVLFVTFGLYGLVSYSVSRRTREIGIRMALGAERQGILRLVLWQALGLSLAGVALGIGLAYLGTGMLESLLFQVEPLDPATLAAAAVLVVAATLAASLIPARRASGISPVVALKQD